MACTVLPHHLRRGRAPVHVHRDALAQADLVEIGGVLAEGLLGPAAGFRVVVEHLRHAPFVDALEVLDLGDDRHEATSPPKLVGNP
jgi:hypothetical protein